MLGDEEDVFESVAWETPSAGYHAQSTADEDPSPSIGPGFRQSMDPDASTERGPHVPKWEGFLITSVQDPVKELPDTKDAYVSYLVSAKVRPQPVIVIVWFLTIEQTNLPIFTTETPSARRRFQAFVFLREHLVKDFPACVVPPLPDKHRIGMFMSSSCVGTRVL